MANNAEIIEQHNTVLEECINKVKKKAVQQYDGAYKLLSSKEDQTLKTTDTVLRDDIVIKAISYTEASNNGGGTTITIGGENG